MQTSESWQRAVQSSFWDSLSNDLGLAQSTVQIDWIVYKFLFCFCYFSLPLLKQSELLFTHRFYQAKIKDK